LRRRGDDLEHSVWAVEISFFEAADCAYRPNDHRP
jgi:hypothetical protein